jgi:hypothetical protein
MKFKTSNEQRATSNEQRATSNEQRATSNEQRATSNEQRATSNEQNATDALSHTLTSSIDCTSLIFLLTIIISVVYILLFNRLFYNSKIDRLFYFFVALFATRQLFLTRLKKIFFKSLYFTSQFCLLKKKHENYNMFLVFALLKLTPLINIYLAHTSCL